MNNWIGLAFLLLLALGAWYGLHVLSRPRKLSEQEFENRVGLGKSLINAGMMGLDKFINPRAAKSIEVVKDMKRGRYDKKQAKGDGDDKADEQ
jgi:hypothetical protein